MNTNHRKFIVLEDVTFPEKHLTGTESPLTKTVPILIPKNSELFVVRETPISFDLDFSTGYKVTTTFEKFENLMASGSIEEI